MTRPDVITGPGQLPRAPFTVDYFPVSPWCRCARRRTGGKIAGGTAR